MRTDPIADMLTRIRNASLASKTNVNLPYSKIKAEIAKILRANSFIENFAVEGKGIAKFINITLNRQEEMLYSYSLIRISKPGRRVYASSRDLPSVLRGKGIVIVSTSSGLMTGQQAKKQNLGGELICKVW